jgi:ornithine cyclodeaminase/alanine dehydrogenase-like protein (mu-crystallin family)
VAIADTEFINYLNEAETRQICEHFDPLEVVRRALIQHGREETVLPPEAYLGWRAPDGASARSLSMPAMLRGGDPSQYTIGAKLINGSLGNVARGLPRASGLTMLFDPLTARITTVMASQHLSALRTACVSVIAAQELVTADVVTVGVIGAGVISRAHIELIARFLPAVTHIALYDHDSRRAKQLVTELTDTLLLSGASTTVASSAEDAVIGANLVIAATTTTTGYLDYECFSPGTVIVNVSLDDVLPDVVQRADLVFVDDWSLVRDDQHRLLGRMARAGQLVGPRDAAVPGARRVDAELGQVLAGHHPGRTRPEQLILVNPFGMALEDLALAAEVARVAERLGIGLRLTR